MDIQQELEDVKREVSELRTDVRELLNLWEQSRGILNFLKFICAIGAAIGGFIIFVKPYLR